MAVADSAGSDLFVKQVLPVFRSTCWQCHGALKTGGLDLRTRESMLKGSSHGAVVIPARAERSRLYRLVAGLGKTQMPPVGKLPAAQVTAIKRWIDAGAPWPASQIVESRPWPYNPVTRPALPRVKNAGWIRNPIDVFILTRLEEKGLRPAPTASRATLIRRASLDLIGLPPTPGEIDAFLNDRSSNAYEKVIDRLLASPHYGERWARHWLDLARYAESEGFKTDEMRPNAWRYRDYVIQSLNRDKPYDQFIQEQIAGDELFPNEPDALIATGFCRHWADESNARNLLQRRQEILNDITDTVGSTILGLTWGCARCHDHKYDPIPQKDYYRLQAFFAGIRPRDDIPLIPSDERPEYDRRLTAWDEKTREARAEMAAIEEPVRQRLAKVSFDKFPAEVQQAVTRPAKDRTAMDWFLFHKAEPYFRVSPADMEKAMKPDQRARWKDLSKQIDAFKSLHPGVVPTGLGITNLELEAPKTYTLSAGVYDQQMQEVQPGFPAVCGAESAFGSRRSALGEASIRNPQSAIRNSTTPRSTLALWLSSPENPLTARVMVNRLWHYHFGRGIVATPSDFGNTGERATHKELLDWLAAELMNPSIPTPNTQHLTPWSLKRIHRLIMTSAAYRQSAAYNARSARIDPDDKLLWRFRRHRLEGEVIRDSILAIGGELNPKMGGQSVMPDLPRGVTTRGYWKETADPRERARRSVYVFVKRNMRYPMFQAFDMPDTHEPCSRRETTTSAPQALMLLNDEVVLHAAQSFAGRVLKESSSLPAEQVSRAYSLALGRAPSQAELAAALRFLTRQAALVAAASDPDGQLLCPIPMPQGMDESAAAALVDLCHALLNANELIYVE